MPKPYIRKSDRGATYTQEKLREAVKAVKNGEISAYAASKLYGIPRPTIVNRVYDRKGLKSNTLGRPTALPLNVEKELAENLHVMEKYGFGLTRKELLEIVGQYVNKNNIETPFKDGIPGEDWFLAFKKRHDLSVKKPQPVEYARKKACSPAVIYPFFDLLEKTIDELGLRDKPSHIWNADETSFSKDPSKSKVVGLRGYTSTRTISSPGKTNTTVLLACNAAGEKAPPLIVYTGKNVWDTWTSEDGYPGTRYAATSNGWMETSVFEKFIEKVFLPAVGEKRPILLLYDGHSTHLSIKVIQTARDNNITIMKIPPHSSDNLQPLDLAVNKSVKDKWDVALVKWQRLNVGKVLPKKDFSRIIGEVWTQIDPLVCAAGFRKAGIYPFNKNAIPENKFDPVLIAEWKRVAILKEKTENISQSPEALTEQSIKACMNENMSKRSEASTDQPVQESTNEETSKRSTTTDKPVKKPNKLKKIALASVNKILFEEQVSPQHISISLGNAFPISINDILCKRSPLKEVQLGNDILNKQSQEKDDTLTKTGEVQQCSKVQILDNRPVISNITFEELLLNTVKPGNISLKTTRKKVAAGAEVITHDEVYERYKVIEAEKQQKLKKQEEKKVRGKNIQTKEGKSEMKNKTIPGPSGLNRKRKNEDKFETNNMNSKKRKGVGKRTQLSLKKKLKNNKIPSKRKYKRRSSSSTSVSDSMCLDDDSDIADLKDLIDEDYDFLNEDFDIISELGCDNSTINLENNITIDQKNKTTETFNGSKERTNEKETVIGNIKTEIKRATKVVCESEERKVEAEIVIGKRKEKRNVTTNVTCGSEKREKNEKKTSNTIEERNKKKKKGEREEVCGLEGRKMEAELVIDNKIEERNVTTNLTCGSKKREKNEKKTRNIIEEGYKKKKKGEGEEVCGLEGRKMEAELVIDNKIKERNVTTNVTCGSEKREKNEKKTSNTIEERNKKKKKGEGEQVCGLEGRKMEAELVIDNKIEERNVTTNLTCGSKKKEKNEKKTRNIIEERYMKKKKGEGEVVCGSEERIMKAEGVDDNLDEEIEESEKEVNYAVNDNVMVRYYSRNKWVYYIGYITTKLSPNPNLYEIRFYKTCKNPVKFKHTKKLDRDTVPAISIVKKVDLLQDPNNLNEFLLSDEEDFIYFS